MGKKTRASKMPKNTVQLSWHASLIKNKNKTSNFFVKISLEKFSKKKQWVWNSGGILKMMLMMEEEGLTLVYYHCNVSFLFSECVKIKLFLCQHYWTI